MVFVVGCYGYFLLRDLSFFLVGLDWWGLCLVCVLVACFLVLCD